MLHPHTQVGSEACMVLLHTLGLPSVADCLQRSKMVHPHTQVLLGAYTVLWYT